MVGDQQPGVAEVGEVDGAFDGLAEHFFDGAGSGFAALLAAFAFLLFVLGLPLFLSDIFGVQVAAHIFPAFAAAAVVLALEAEHAIAALEDGGAATGVAAVEGAGRERPAAATSIGRRALSTTMPTLAIQASTSNAKTFMAAAVAVVRRASGASPASCSSNSTETGAMGSGMSSMRRESR